MKNALRDAPIGLKVSLAPTFAILCLLLVAALGWLANRSSVDDLKAVGGAGLQRVLDAQGFASQLGGMHQKVYQSLTWEAIGQRAEMIKQFDDALVAEIASFGKAVDLAAQDGDLSPEQRERMAAFAKGYGTYAKFARDTLDIKASGLATAASFVPTLDLEYKSSSARLADFVSHELEGTRANIGSAEAAAQRNLRTVGLAVLVAVVMSVALSVMLSRAISRPLAQAAGIAGSLAEGDLTHHVTDAPSDATGKVLGALQEVSDNLGRIVTDIRATAEQINTASNEIASGNADLSSRTEGAATSLQQTAASIGQLSESIKASADNAQQVDRLAQEASQVAREGGSAVGAVVQTMDGISAQARKIGEIVSVIDGIAFQTNILALNAAVEAARAGEQGRGFAVVAQEVRTLAGRSGEAAREIRTLIGHSVDQAEAGSAKVQVAGDTMERIVEAIQRVTTRVEAISRATVEQAQGIAQVNQSVNDMDRATQQNAAMVQEAGTATDSLKSQAGNLVELLRRFRTA